MTETTMSPKPKTARPTPGPWKLAQESIDPEWHIISAAAGRRLIANVHIESGNAMEVANARLLIAAPELLAACREAYNAAMYLFSNEGGSAWSGLAKQLHDAIAKAEGRLA
jgi:hypothetical protein